MPLKTFQRKLEAYGADLARWPAGDAITAARLLEESDAAKDFYRQAQALERALNEVTVPPAPHLAITAANAALTHAKLTQAPVRRQRTGFHWPSFAGGGIAFAALALVMAVSGNPLFPHHDRAAAREVGAFMQDLDRMHNDQQAQLKEADDMVSMLSPEQERGSGR